MILQGGRASDTDIILVSVLKSQENAFISGEDLASLLKISRASIWKHILALRKCGYQIESASYKGYRLVQSPDLPLPTEILPGLDTEIIPSEYLYYHETESTNNVGADLGNQGTPEGTVVVADSQTHARGRLGRSFLTPPGVGVWMSVVLNPPMEPHDSGKLTVMAAVAVAEAVRGSCSIEPQIKWPNDILISGKKVCGILTEMTAEQDRIKFIVLGIGLNVSQSKFPGELADTAISLQMATEEPVERNAVLARLLKELDTNYRRLLRGGFEEILNRWRELSGTLNREIVCESAQGVIRGKAVDLAPDGALLIESEHGKIRRVYSGDVTVLD